MVEKRWFSQDLFCCALTIPTIKSSNLEYALNFSWAYYAFKEFVHLARLWRERHLCKVRVDDLFHLLQRLSPYPLYHEILDSEEAIAISKAMCRKVIMFCNKVHAVSFAPIDSKLIYSSAEPKRPCLIGSEN